MTTTSGFPHNVHSRLCGMTPVAATLVAALVLAAPARAEQDPGALVDAVLEAYGGWERLSEVTAYRIDGTVMTSHGAAASPTTRVFERPCRLRVVIEYADRTETRIVDGERGWRSGKDGTIAPAQGPLLDSMRLQCSRAALPWILAEHRDAVRLIESPPAADESLTGLEVPLGEGLVLRAFVDSDSGRILRALSVLDHPAMQIAFETRYSDFREIDGVLFAHREENYAGGRHTASTSIDSVVTNPELDEAAFRP